MIDRNIDSNFMFNINIIYLYNKFILFNNITVVTEDFINQESLSSQSSSDSSNNNESSSDSESELDIDFDNKKTLNVYMASAISVGTPLGVKSETLSKI